MQGADLRGQGLVALGRLRAPRGAGGQFGLQFARQIVQPLEIGQRGAHAQFGLVSAPVQAGDAARLLEDPAPVLRLGADQFGNLALADEGRRIGPAGSVGEQDLNIAGADLTAIDAIGRAFPTIDAPGDFQHRMGVERRRRPALGVVDGQGDLGVVAGRPPARTGKDHVVHALAAHGLGRGGAHHPAQGLQEVGLAAAVGADDAGQAGLDAEVRGIDEGLEARKPQAGEVHGATSAGRRARGLGDGGGQVGQAVCSPSSRLPADDERRRAGDMVVADIAVGARLQGVEGGVIARGRRRPGPG